MEETFIWHASHEGDGLLTNSETYQRWVRTMHTRSQFVNATINMADMLTGSERSTTHIDLHPSDPFTVEEKDKLVCLSCGAV